MKSSSHKKTQTRLSIMAVAFEQRSIIQQRYNSIRTSTSCYNCSDKRGVPEEGGHKDNDNDIPYVEFSSTRGYFIVKA